MSRLRLIARGLGFAGLLAVFGACAPTLPNVPTTTTIPGSSIPDATVGYYTEWSIYARNFHPKNLIGSGAADELTHLSVAFGNVVGGQCVQGDAWAEIGKPYSAADSVDGVADSTAPGTLKGIFGQLRKLKAAHPDLKVLWSFGGASWSGGFAQAAANPTSFAASCRALVEDPRWADVFDGIDIDWEYPGAADAAGYTAILAALRQQFGTDLVTSAVPASPSRIAVGGYGNAAAYVDWFNVMAYDYFGTWAPNGPTAAHSSLTAYPGIPSATLTVQSTISAYRNFGIAASKLVLGMGAYGRGWTGVTQPTPGGSATGPAAGTYQAGVEDYKVLSSTCPPTGTIGGTAYAHCGTNWWSYDTPTTIASKMQWARSQGLRGGFLWELSGDSAAGALIAAMADGS